MMLDGVELEPGAEEIRPYTFEAAIAAWVLVLASLGGIVGCGYLFLLALTDLGEGGFLSRDHAVVVFVFLTIFVAVLVPTLRESIVDALRWINGRVVIGRSALIYVNWRRRKTRVPWDTVTSLRLRDVLPGRDTGFRYVFLGYLDATGRSSKLELGARAYMTQDAYDRIVGMIISRAGLSRSSTRKMRFGKSETVHERG